LAQMLIFLTVISFLSLSVRLTSRYQDGKKILQIVGRKRLGFTVWKVGCRLLGVILVKPKRQLSPQFILE
jgi:hypothetical protein